MPLPMDIGSVGSGPVREQELAVPNYSRFPGKQKGLLSKPAATVIKDRKN